MQGWFLICLTNIIKYVNLFLERVCRRWNFKYRKHSVLPIQRILIETKVSQTPVNMETIVSEEKMALEILKLTVKKRVKDDLDKLVKSVYESIGLKDQDGSNWVTMQNGTLDKDWPQMKAVILKFASEEADRLAKEAIPPGTLV